MKDINYDYNVDMAKGMGLPFGSYLFLTSKFSIDDQFKFFRSTVKPEEQDLVPMVDVETGHFDDWSRKQRQDSVAKFCSLVGESYGVKPMIYSNQNFYNYWL